MNSWHLEDKVVGITNQLLLAILQQLEEMNGANIYKDWKRPDLMKKMTEYPDRPQGFDKWKTEDMIKFLLSKE